MFQQVFGDLAIGVGVLAEVPAHPPQYGSANEKRENEHRNERKAPGRKQSSPSLTGLRRNGLVRRPTAARRSSLLRCIGGRGTRSPTFRQAARDFHTDCTCYLVWQAACFCTTDLTLRNLRRL